MIRLALTGSIGMGKSTVAQMFERAGVPVFDADAVVRELQARNGGGTAAMGKRLRATGGGSRLDRDELARRVLGHPNELAALEAIVHPAVHSARTRFILDHADAAALLFDIPLLFETGGDEAFDKVIVVSAPAEVQGNGVLPRPGMTGEKLDAILARLVRDEENRRGTDFVVDTGTDLSTTEAQVRDILSCLGIPAVR